MYQKKSSRYATQEAEKYDSIKSSFIKVVTYQVTEYLMMLCKLAFPKLVYIIKASMDRNEPEESQKLCFRVLHLMRFGQK